MRKSLSLVAALVAVVFTGSTFAYSPTDATAKSAVPVIRLVPSKVVQPTDLPRTFARAVVNVEFSLNQAGQPQDIKVLSTNDRVLKERIVQAFSQWRFDAAAQTPGAIAKRFVLPLEIVPEV